METDPGLDIDFFEPTESEINSQPKPARMEVAAQNIPPELRALRQWVCWKCELTEKAEWSKRPKNPRSGGNAMSTNQSTWSSFEEARQAYQSGGYDGVGFVFSPEDPYCGIDLDKCRDPETGKIEKWAVEILEKIDSYAEVSPSSTGIKIIAKGSLPGKGTKRGNIEIYDQSRYFTVTGHYVEGYPVKPEPRQDVIEALYQKINPPRESPSPPQKLPQPTNLLDQELLDLATKSKNGAKFDQLWAGDWQGAGYPSQSEADLALCMYLAFWTGGDPVRIGSLFRQSGLYRNKWNREDYRERTISGALNRTTEYYQPKTRQDPPLTPEHKPVVFPSSVIAGLAGEFADLYSTYLEPPTHFFYMAFLGCLGALVADRLTLSSEIAPQPRLYLVFLGESADDRKSTTLVKTISFCREATEDFAVCWGVGSAEGLQKRLKKDGRLLLTFDEFKQFVGKCQAQGSVLLPCINTLFELNHYENHTKNTEVCIDGAYLTIMAASTVQTYENTWSSQFTDIGFNNRLFLVPGSGERKFSFPAKIPENEKYLLKQRLGKVLRHVGDELELNITSDAKELFHDWYMNQEQSIHSKRLDGYALRFMSLLTVNELKNKVDTEVVKKVLALCDWQFTVRQLHDPIGADNETAKMEEKIRRVLKAKGPLRDWQLRQFCNVKRKGIWFYNSAKKNLHSSQELRLKNKLYHLIS